MDVTAYADYIKPELLVLVPVLYAIGSAMKKSEWIADKHIPVALGISGIVLAALYVLATSTINSSQDVFMAIFTAIVQGILCAAASVYVNNIVKQERASG